MIEILSWLLRAVLVGGALVAAGHVLVLILHGHTASRIAPAILVLLGAIGSFLMQAAALTGSLTGAFDPAMLGLLWGTSQGLALTLFGSGAVLLIISAGLGVLMLQTLGAGIILAGFLVVGHVADASGFVLSAVLFAHLCFAAYWVGVLAPLFRLAEQDPAAAASLGVGFGRLAVLGIPILVALGVFLVFRLLGNLDQLWTTSYGLVLLGKVGAVAAMLALGAANKLRHVPALREGRQGAGRALRRSLICEAGAALIVIGATASFSTLTGLP